MILKKFFPATNGDKANFFVISAGLVAAYFPLQMTTKQSQRLKTFPVGRTEKLFYFSSLMATMSKNFSLIFP
ncbi:MAG: hypothetical protein IJT21_07600 [Synergistaceae bacterium]|nr:hypothetical protein [Synergistaceae bacterium]